VRVSTLKVLNSFHPCSSLQVCGRRSPEPDFFLSASRFATPSASRSWRPLQALDLRIKGSRSFKRQICKDMSRVEPRVAWIVDTLYFSWEIIAFPAISLPSSDQGRLRAAEGSRGLLDASNSRNNEIWVWKRLICTSVDTPKCSSHSVYSMTTVSRGAQNLSSHLQLYIFLEHGNFRSLQCPCEGVFPDDKIPPGNTPLFKDIAGSIIRAADSKFTSPRKCVFSIVSYPLTFDKAQRK
jgi:hypothetical protein